jgi:hypothetical protein
VSKDRLLVIAQELEDRAKELRELSDVVTGGSPPDVVTGGPASKPEDASGWFGDHGAFYDSLRDARLLGQSISQAEFRGIETLLIACANAQWGVSWIAYALATAYHETGHTMQPVREAFWLEERDRNAYLTRQYDIAGRRPNVAREYENTQPGDGIKYAGRCYVQLTWKRNYRVMTERLRRAGWDIDLVADPDRALDPEVAAAIIVIGMSEGLFTGRGIGDDLPRAHPASLEQFIATRDTINGTDAQRQIAEYAIIFQTALQEGRYRIKRL